MKETKNSKIKETQSSRLERVEKTVKALVQVYLVNQEKKFFEHELLMVSMLKAMCRRLDLPFDEMKEETEAIYKETCGGENAKTSDNESDNEKQTDAGENKERD